MRMLEKMSGVKNIDVRLARRRDGISLWPCQKKYSVFSNIHIYPSQGPSEHIVDGYSVLVSKFFAYNAFEALKNKVRSNAG